LRTVESSDQEVARGGRPPRSEPAEVERIGPRSSKVDLAELRSSESVLGRVARGRGRGCWTEPSR
jgi:hypothetical protein